MAFPKSLFSSKSVVIEMAYKPKITKLLQVAAENDAQTVQGSFHFSFFIFSFLFLEINLSKPLGAEILIEQALYQFKTWCCCEAPRDEITKKVYSAE